MKKNNTLKRTMAGAMAVVSLAAYMPVTAALGTPILNSIVADAAEYGSNINLYSGDVTLTKGDIIDTGVRITPGVRQTWTANYNNILNYSVVNGKGETISNQRQIEGNSYIWLDDRSKVNSFSSSFGSNRYTYNLVLELIDVANVTLESGAVVAGATPEDGKYKFEENKTYTVYSNKTLQFDDESAGNFDVAFSTSSNGFTQGGATYKYKYTVTVNELTEDIAVAFKHVHDIKIYGYDTNDVEKNMIHLTCEGEPAPTGGEQDENIHNNAYVIARLGAEGEYYYGEAPGSENVLPTDYAKAFDVTIEQDSIEMYYTKKGQFNGTHLGLPDLEVGNEYTAWAIVPVTYGKKTTEVRITKDFRYSPRPLRTCKVYYLDEEGKEQPCDVDDKGNVTGIPPYVYNGKKQGPTIVVRDPLTDEVVDDKTKYVISIGDEYTTSAINVDTYHYELNADKNEDDEYADTLIINWSIDTADAEISAVADGDIIYDGEPVDLFEDFKIEGANAGIVTKDNARLEPVGDDDMTSAGNHQATLIVEDSNYEDGVARRQVNFVIKPRAVKLTPKADAITYGEVLSIQDKVDYKVEEAKEGSKRGLISSDLEDGQTAQEFFGERFKVDSNFRYGFHFNDAGTYKYAENKIDSVGKAKNYDVEIELTVDNQDVAVFTIKPKALTDDMFTAPNTKFTYMEDTEQKVEWVAHDLIENSEGLTVNDYDQYGTDNAVFPGEYAVEYFGKGNYTGKAYLKWVINPDETHSVTVKPDDELIYNGDDVEKNNWLDVTCDVAGAKLTYTYYKVDVETGKETKMKTIPVEAGSYKVVVSASKKGYVIKDGEAYFTINKDGVEIAVNELSKVFGDADPNFTYSVVKADAVADDDDEKVVTVEGTLKLKGKNDEEYKGYVGEYKFDTSDLIVKVNGVVDPSYVIKTKDTFEVTKRRLEDANVVSEGAVFNENDGIAEIIKGFKVVAKGADGKDTELVYTSNPLLQNGDYTLVTGSQSKTENGDFIVTVKGCGNYMGYAEATIKVDAGYAVNVINGTIKNKNTSSARLNKDSKATVIADEAPEGKKFGYWKKNGSTASYNASYSFVVSSNIELEAVYVDSDDSFDKAVQARITASKKIVEDNKEKLLVTSEVGVPEGCKIVKAGLVATSNKDKAKTLSVDTVSSNSDTFVKLDSGITARNYVYDWKKNNVKDGDVWYVKSCVIYTDENGTEITKYGDLVEATFEGTTVLEEAEVKTSRSITSTKAYYDTKDKVNKVEFVSEVSVPADCKIVEGGIVATDKAADKDKLDVKNCVYKRSNADDNQNVTAHTYIYTWKKKQQKEYGDTWYVKSYLIYETPIGNRYTVYGDEVAECSFNDIA